MEYSRNPHERTFFYKNLEAEIPSVEPLNNNIKEPESGNGSYIIGFMLSEIIIQG